jgi:DNA-directed RNA polymerase subunit F
LVAQDQLLEDQENLLEQERKNTCELKKLLKLEKEKNEELAQELANARRLSLVSRAQVILFKTHMISCKRLIKILK